MGGAVAAGAPAGVPAVAPGVPAVAAVDLGATSGRVMLGELRDGRLLLDTVHRFGNGPVPLGGRTGALAWDIDDLWGEIRRGLRLAFERHPDIVSIGIDSWAVDYALLAGPGGGCGSERDRVSERGGAFGRVGASGRVGTPGRLRASERLGPVRHYRDPRNERAVPELERVFSREDLFRRNGLQFLPFTTVYQLEAERMEAEEAGPDAPGTSRVAQADALLLVPDYIAWLLTGAKRCERTNASTTGLLRAEADGGSPWDEALARHLGVARLLPPIIEPGEVYGALRPELAEEFGAAAGVNVTAVASHDTASAVAAVPLTSLRSAYVSCGTWGLVGVELDGPVLTDEARVAGFTNEIGIDGTVRFLKNVTGTWLLSESIAHWRRDGGASFDLDRLLAEAADLPAPEVLIDPADERFLAPGDMPARLAAAAIEVGGSAPTSPAATIRLIVESLAASFAREARDAARLGGFELDAIHIVGGGSQGELLCQRTAQRAGVPVIAGPVECTALGNALVQLRSLDDETWGRSRIREIVRSSVHLRRYEPV